MTRAEIHLNRLSNKDITHCWSFVIQLHKLQICANWDNSFLLGHFRRWNAHFELEWEGLLYMGLMHQPNNAYINNGTQWTNTNSAYSRWLTGGKRSKCSNWAPPMRHFALRASQERASLYAQYLNLIITWKQGEIRGVKRLVPNLTKNKCFTKFKKL